ncbi:MAG TPA: septum site-determining protein MinC [Oleiagrimonas sp.]|nr:septum site-determining protein MinC [Oleiagrimonas sp.]
MSTPLPSGETACDLRFGQVGLACVRVRQADAAALCDDLERRVHAAPQLFTRVAVVLDLSHLAGGLPDDGTVDALLEAVRTAGMLPVGLAYGDSQTDALAQRMGLPVIAKFREAFNASTAPVPPADATASAPKPATTPPATAESLPETTTAQSHTQTVRSGQQVYARDRDLVITATVANGAEVIADGSIHVYGTLRGRALVGAQGDADARIYCTDFRPELISIAGHYRVFEEIPSELAGKAVQCRLDGEKLLIETL